MAQVAAGIEAIPHVDIHVACSLGMLTQEQVDRLAEMGVHRYNHNLESARSFFPNVVHHPPGRNAVTPCRWSATPGWRSAAAASRWGNPEQRAEFAAELAELDPHEVPLNFLNPVLAPRSATSGDAGRRGAQSRRRIPVRPAAHHAAVRRRAGSPR